MKRLKTIISKLQKQRRELDEILADLREIETSPSKAKSAASLDEHERAVIVQALLEAKGNQSIAAKALGIGRDKLRYKVAKHEIGW